ncbi:MAG: monovalent cation/H(+) antiporter subunit G [Anaerovoracaceae bacterium]
MIREILASGFLISGFIFMIISTVGVLKFDDFYKRLHASGVGESFAFVLMAIGLFIYDGLTFTSVKIFFIILALFMINTVGTHLIAKAAYQSKHGISKEEKNADNDN